MRALIVNASPHSTTSHSYLLAKELIANLQEASGQSDQNLLVIERDLVAQPLPIIGEAYATAVTSRTPALAAFDWSERLIGELEETEVLVIATPMHNFTVPAALKLWIDHVLRIHRTFTPTQEGKMGLMHDRATYVIVGSGGFHAGEKARQPDFLTPYLRYALGSIGINNVKFIFLQGLVFGDEAVADALFAARRELMMEAQTNFAAAI